MASPTGSHGLTRHERKKSKNKLKRQQRRHMMALERVEYDELVQELLDVEEAQMRLKHEIEERAWFERERQSQEEFHVRQQALKAMEREQRESEEARERVRLKGAEILATALQVRASLEQKPVSSNDRSAGNNQEAHCVFYAKTGSCSAGLHCEKLHQIPSSSSIILLKNMYRHSKNCDDRSRFEEFFHDVLAEFRKFGNVVQLTVCSNQSPHLSGNVYVQFSDVRSAVSAHASLNGRYFDGIRLAPEFAPIVQWTAAVCGLHEKHMCPCPAECNFLHVFPNPGKLPSGSFLSNVNISTAPGDSSPRRSKRHKQSSP